MNLKLGLVVRSAKCALMDLGFIVNMVLNVHINHKAF